MNLRSQIIVALVLSLGIIAGTVEARPHLVTRPNLEPHQAVIPIPRHETPEWTEKFGQHLELLDQIDVGSLKTVFLGDSITESWNWEGRPVWQHAFGTEGSLALGIGGDRTEHLLWRLQNGYMERFSRLKPQTIVLLIGTNNVWFHSERQIADGVLDIIELLRQGLPHARLVVTAILPYGQEPNQWRDRNNGVNRILAVQLKAMEQENVKWLDLNRMFLDDSGAMRSELTTDYLHLTHAGYQVWADALIPVLRPPHSIQQ